MTMFKPKLFSREEIRMSDAEFKEASDSLMESGLLEKVVIDGKVLYRATKLCCEAGAQVDSDSSLRN